MKTKITELLGIEYPIVQGAMAWIAEHHLAAAVSKAGGLGIIAGGAASNDAEAACLGYGSGEMMLGDPRHRALHDRIFDAEKFCDLGFHNKTPLFFTVSVQMRHR